MAHAAHILDPIVFQPDEEDLLTRMNLQRGTAQADRFLELLAQAVDIARPKAAHRLCRVRGINDRKVDVDGVTLTSRLLSRKLQGVRRVFIGLATCGREVAAWAAGFEPLLERFWIDTIMEDALRRANDELNRHIQDLYHPGRMASICPGSLQDWPLSQQKQIFDLAGREASRLGIELLASMLMQPLKSVSRIIFPSDTAFYSCQYCPMKDCPSRQAPCIDPSP